jgi:hypothetical protein
MARKSWNGARRHGFTNVTARDVISRAGAAAPVRDQQDACGNKDQEKPERHALDSLQHAFIGPADALKDIAPCGGLKSRTAIQPYKLFWVKKRRCSQVM